MTAARGGGEPINVDAVLAGFEEVYSPRIVARVNDYDRRCRG